jgi:hypothetical protein
VQATPVTGAGRGSWGVGLVLPIDTVGERRATTTERSAVPDEEAAVGR